MELNFSQLEILLDQAKMSGSPHYNIGGYADVNGKIHPEKMAAAFAALAEENPVFFTEIVSNDDGVSQRISAVEIPFCHKDFSAHADPEASAHQWIFAQFNQPFDVHQPPLFRTGLICLGPEHYWYYGVAHHIVTDGWGFANWCRRVFEWYSALEQGDQQPSGEVLEQFSNILSSQSGFAGSEKYQKSRQYWLDKLSSVPSLNFSGYAQGGPKPSGFRKTLWSQQQFDQIKSFAKAHGTAVQPLFLALLHSYFCRLNGQNQSLFGVPSHNRKGAKQKRVIGAMMGFSPVLIDGEQDLSIVALAKNIAQSMKADYRHQGYPLSHLYQDLGLREQGRPWLFDVQFNFQPISFDVTDLGINAHCHFITGGYEPTPLVVTICDYGSQQPVSFQLDHHLDFLSETEAALFEQRLMSMLEQLMSKPDLSIAELNMQSAQDIEVQQAANRTEMPLDCHRNLLEQLSHLAEVQGEQSAVYDQRWWNYTELTQAIENYHKKLQKLGVKPDDRVAICLDRDHHLLAVMAAIWHCGASFIPLDSTWPVARLNMMIEDSRAAFVIVDEQLSVDLTYGQAVPLSLSQLSQLSTEDAALTATSHFDIARPAYILFTSGSTGRPKGVEVGHQALHNFILTMAQKPGISPDDRFLALTTIAFDIAMLELWLPLFAGAAVLLAPQAAKTSPELLVEMMVKHQVTMMQATPSGWQMLLNSGWQGKPDLVMLCGGEPLPKVMAEKLVTKGKRLWNLYGPTETTIWSSVTEISAPVEQITIGQPIGNTQFYILDREHRPMPLNAVGELHIAGDGLANGYFDQPQLTSERFAQRQWLSGVKTYGTGDLAKQRPDGQFEVIGRIDNQVKLNGFRIELGEIETQLAKMPQIKDVAVKVIQDQADSDNSKDMLAAWYISAKADELPDISAIRQQLRLNLPAYMVPKAFVPIEQFAMTNNGKKDLKALPQPTAEHLQQAQSRLPDSELEKVIAQVICEVGEIAHIGVDDNYFDAGVSSLALVEVANRLNLALKQQLSTQLQATTLFSYPSISQLTAHIGAKADAKPAAENNAKVKKRQTGQRRLNKMLEKRKKQHV